MILLRNFILAIKTDGSNVTLANDATRIEIDNDNLVYVCEDGGSRETLSLDQVDSVIIEVNP